MMKFQQVGNTEYADTWRNMVKALQTSQDPTERNQILRKVPISPSPPPIHHIDSFPRGIHT